MYTVSISKQMSQGQLFEQESLGLLFEQKTQGQLFGQVKILGPGDVKFAEGAYAALLNAQLPDVLALLYENPPYKTTPGRRVVLYGNSSLAGRTE